MEELESLEFFQSVFRAKELDLIANGTILDLENLQRRKYTESLARFPSHRTQT
jgi:hypothetical protein